MRPSALALGLLVLLPTACRKTDAMPSSPPQTPAVEPEPSAPTAEPGEAPSSDLASEGEPTPSGKPAQATVKGSLDADIVSRIVRAHINEVRYCYDEQRKVSPDLSGQVTVQFAIGPDGQVEVATVAGVEPEHEGLIAVGECAIEYVKRWRFATPGDGGRVVVTYPFVFSPE